GATPPEAPRVLEATCTPGEVAQFVASAEIVPPPRGGPFDGLFQEELWPQHVTLVNLTPAPLGGGEAGAPARVGWTSGRTLTLLGLSAATAIGGTVEVLLWRDARDTWTNGTFSQDNL